MKKPKTVEALTLPEEVIQHIQSFMSGKEAARTTILSKSWYAAWLTRPAIDLDYQDFGRNAHKVFEEFTKKTMQRYEDLNLKIQSFRLRSNGSKRSDGELIANAIKIGATHLQLEMYWAFALPQEVLRSETLLQLSLNDCYVDGNGSCIINCSSLKSLTLRNVRFFGGDVFKDIISCCISIEELSLSELRGLRLEQSIELHKLRRLSLSWVDVDALIFTNFASRFPCLKDLTLHGCGGSNKIHIATTSLQTISFKPRIKSQRAKFDVPNIRKFTYSGFDLPSHLSINGASSREWELNISIACYDLQKTSWFMNLKKLLNKFRRSKISLFIDLCANRKGQSVDVEVMPKPLVVENLTITARPAFCCTLLCQSFGAFRAKFITLCDSRNSYPSKHQVKANDVFSKSLIQALFVSNCQEEFERFGLKKLNVQICEGFDKEWRTLELKKALTSKALTASEAKVRLQLIWDD